jgi:WD40 repeat protein
LSAALAGLLVLLAVIGAFWGFRENQLRRVANENERAARFLQRESTSRLARYYFQQGIQYLESGDLMRSSLWLAEALSVDQQNEELQRIRLGMINQATPELTHLWALPAEVTALRFSPTGKLVLAGTNRGDIFAYDLDAANAEPNAYHHHQIVVDTKFSPDGSRFVSVDIDEAAQLWDAATGRRIASLAHADRVWDAAFSADGKLVATVGEDGLPALGTRPTASSSPN